MFLCRLLLSLCLAGAAAHAGPPVKQPGRVGKPPRAGQADTRPIRLHSGWQISPVGQVTVLNDTVLASVLSPDGKTLALVSGGASAHQVVLWDVASGKIRQTLALPRAQSRGAAWSADGNRLYIAGGNARQVNVVTVAPSGVVALAPPLIVAELRNAQAITPDLTDATPQDLRAGVAYLSGLAVSTDDKTVYVTNLPTDAVYALDAATGSVKARLALDKNDRPGCVRVSADGKSLYVALWARNTVMVLDAASLEKRQVFSLGSTERRVQEGYEENGLSAVETEVGMHPNDLCVSRDGRLFVSCGNADAVLVLDGKTGQVVERIALGLIPKAPPGATPSALALSPDGKNLLVACAGNNALALVDVSRPGRASVRGLLPTASYPTTTAWAQNGKTLFVGSAKGLGTGPNDKTDKIDPVAPKGYPAITRLLQGVLQAVPVPDGPMLARYTRQVYDNCPYARNADFRRPRTAPKAGTNPVPSRVGDASPIKYVLYIIKENRTYDQVLGDMTGADGKPSGNGDARLCLFGEQVTPNHHALAREYVLLDNFYADGEVSVDGHHWSNGAYVPDFMQQTWPSQYGGKGTPPLTAELAATPSGRIWDLCERAKVSFRTYYYHTQVRQSAEWAQARKAGMRDYQAADIYLRDLNQWEKSGEMPRYQIMALSEDHTRGTTPGAFTPQAAVASNDLAIGKIVEACSRSRFWKQMAIFIVEDDAQNGPDHVDAHRTVALAISPYTRHGGRVDSTFYTTCSLLRTQELILGLPPMSQYDASALPLYAAFSGKADTTPYQCRLARIALDTRNTAQSVGAQASLGLDLSEPDHLSLADEQTLNRVLWHSIKGANVPYPAPVRRMLFTPGGRSLHPSPSRAAEPDDD